MLRRFNPGDHLARAGTPISHVVVIQRGLVGVDARGHGWRALTIDLAGPGELLGEHALLGQDRWETDVVALRPGSAAFIAAPHLHRLRSADRSIDALANELVAARLQRLTERLVETSLVPLRSRLRHLLHRLDALFAPDPIRLTHEQIARMLGTNRSTVSELLAAEARLGLVETRRGLVRVLDASALAPTRAAARSS